MQTLSSARLTRYTVRMQETFIRKRRREISLNVPDLAMKVGVSETAAWNWDRGTSLPKEEFVSLIAVALGISEARLRDNLVRMKPETNKALGSLDKVLLGAREALARHLRIDVERIDLQLSIRADHSDLKAEQESPSAEQG